MKTRKQIILIGLLAIFTSTFTACPPDNNECTHEWEWKVTTSATYVAEGLETETCTICGETSGDTRTIAIIPRGYVAEIPIYQTVGVSDADAVATVDNIQTAWSMINSNVPVFIEETVTKIEIVETQGVVLNSGVLKIEANFHAMFIAATLNVMAHEAGY